MASARVVDETEDGTSAGSRCYDNDVGQRGWRGGCLPTRPLRTAGARAMFVVIFEVQPKAERWDDYLETAGLLRPELVRIEGFVDNERFRSERSVGRVLSLSTWRDEKALIRWRAHGVHHTLGQERGRAEVFAEYRLRVGEVMADTHPPAGLALCQQRFDTTEVGAAKAVTIAEVPPGGTAPDGPTGGGAGQAGLVDAEWFESIYQPGKRVLLAAWAEEARGELADLPGTRLRRVRIIRDYGMRERREAPQYFPAVP